MMPTGTVTFQLTDIEGSTRLWESHGDVMGGVIERHYALIEHAVASHGGVLVKSRGEGDSTFSVFTRPSDAVVAAVEAQDALAAEAWPAGIEIKVRAAIHTGEAELRDSDYYGPAVNRCARIRAVAHGGQVVCSQATADLVADGLEGLTLRSLGTHRLKDLERTEHIHQVGGEDFPPLRSLDAFRHNLPTQRTSFVGRRDQLDHVRGLLSNDRLVTLTGIGGSGKTRLALQVAAEELDDYEDGVSFCELAQITEAEDVAVQLARAIGYPLGGPMDARSLRDDLLATLALQHSLLILDNCEHLIDTCAELADDILERCPRVRLLVTTREALEVEGERTFSVPSLEIPAEGDIGEVESVRLFVDRAASVIDGFSLRSDDAEAIAEICRRLDGIPLAIELAAGQLVTFTPQQITERLADRFMLLTGGRRRVQRQHTLAAAMDWSYDLLSEAEQTFLRRLSVFPGRFTLEQAEAVCAVGLREPGVRLLGGLVSKSLVETSEDDGGRRYRLLETVRLYAEEKLLASGEADDLRSRHRDHFLDWITRSERLLEESSFNPQLQNLVDIEGPNIRAALAWASKEGRSDQVALFASQSLSLWMQGSLDEGARWIAEGLTCTDLEPTARFNLLMTGAMVGLTRLDLPVWGSCAAEAVSLSEHAPNRFYVANVHAQLALYRALELFLFGMDHKREEALSLAERAERELAASDLHEDSRDLVLLFTALAYSALDELDDAVRVLDIEAPADTGMWRKGALSTVLSVRGDYRAALHEGREVERLLESSVWAPRIMDLWLRLPKGLALAGVGEHDEALSAMREVLGGESDALDHGVGTSAVVMLGAMAELRGDAERAARLIGAANVAMEAFKFRSPLDFILRDHHLKRLREALPPERLDELVTDGRCLSLAEAIELGLQD